MRNLSAFLGSRLLMSHYVLSSLVVFALISSPRVFAQSQQPLLSPVPEYKPQKVVEIVIDALKSNSEARGDDGIATVFRFASPRNRAHTGPLNRFSNMIKRGFPDMLNHAEARYEPIEISGDTAVQKVWLYNNDGTEIGYAFQLGLQSGGEFDGCWMTDAVIPLGESAESGTSI